MTNQTILALLATAVLLPAAPALAEENQSNEDTLIAKKSLSELRKDMNESEEAFYTLFNKHNDDREYNVRCHYERQTGTRIKNHVCRAKFVSDALLAHASRNRGSIVRLSGPSANPELAQKSAIFEQKLNAAIAASPELQTALGRFNTASARFAEKQAQNSRQH